jgi:hypothetical protein
MNNDCHFFDDTINKHYNDFVKHLDKVDKSKELEIWKNIYKSSPNDLKPVILRIFNDDLIDKNVNDRPLNLGARLWLKIYDNNDLKELFYNQLRDMRDTNGFCAQGRTNRFIQILFCLI